MRGDIADFIFILVQKFLRIAQHFLDGDVLHARHIFRPRSRTFVLAARMAGFGRLQEDVLGVVRVKSRHGACAEHRDDGHVHRDADVHGAGIRRDKERTFLEERRKLGERDASREGLQHRMIAMAHLGTAGADEFFIHRPAEEGDTVTFLQKIVGSLCKISVDPALRLPTRANVQGDDLRPGGKGVLPELCRAFCRAFGQPHLQAAVVDALDADGFFQHIEVGMDLMLDRLLVFHDLVKEGGKEGLCIADNAPCTREGRERRSAFVAVQVDDEVEMLAANAADKAQKSERMIIRSLLVEQKAAVDMLVADDEIGELLVCEKRDARLRAVRPKRPEDGRHEHEVADVHEVDDKDVGIVFLLHK